MPVAVAPVQWLADMPALAPLNDQDQGALEDQVPEPMSLEEWQTTLPPSLFNLYWDKFLLMKQADDPDGFVEDGLEDLMDIALERHGHPDMDQTEWLDLFETLSAYLVLDEKAVLLLQQFRFSYELFLELIPTLTNDEMDALRPYIEWSH
jgi:hypothetical protein